MDGQQVHCKYLVSGPPGLCYACASRRLEPLSDPDKRCEICDQPYEQGRTTCGNWLCRSTDRLFDRDYAIAMRSGVLADVINRYKVRNGWGWSIVFGRILVGFLEARREMFRSFDLIISSPTFVGPKGRMRDHTRLVLEQAQEYAPDQWPFDLEEPAAITKMSPTKPMRGLSGPKRDEVAHGELREALHVPDPTRTSGKSILVYDDVFTGGRTLNEVARALLVAGNASEVCGVSLSRQPWAPR